MPIKVSACNFCKNRIGGNKCKAFPKGIPSEFLFGEEVHDSVVKGQEGEFVFEVTEDQKGRELYKSLFD